MDWNIAWIFRGSAAYLFVIVNLIRTLMGKSKGWEILLFCSLAFGILTVLEEYRMVDHWLVWGEMNSVSRVVPVVSDTLTAAVWLGIILNLVVLTINLKRK